MILSNDYILGLELELDLSIKIMLYVLEIGIAL